MPSLYRAETRGSVESWWSDSNPLLRTGPTINLHVVTKPLLRRMYHQQARGFIANNHALSGKLLEIYSTYLSYKYVSADTRVLVLEHLIQKAHLEPDNARQILHSPVLSHIPHMLSDDRLRTKSCSLVGVLLASVFGVSDIVDEIITLLREEIDNVVIDLTLAFGTGPQTGNATAVVTALLGSGHSGVQQWTCTLIQTVTRHRPGILSILEGGPLKHLDLTDECTALGAISALDAITEQREGAVAVLSTDLLKHAPDLLKSSLPNIRQRAFALISTLATYEPAVLNNSNGYSIRALLDLSQAASQSEVMRGWDARGGAIVIEYSPQLSSSDSGRSGYILAVDLKTQKLGVSALESQSKQTDMLLNLLCGNDYHIAAPAVLRLIRIVVELDETEPKTLLLEHFVRKIKGCTQCELWYVRNEACILLATLAKHEIAIRAIIETGTVEALAILLRDPNNSVASEALAALTNIAEHSDGARAVLTPGVLHSLPTFFSAGSVDAGSKASVFLSILRNHEFGVLGMLQANITEALLGPLSSEGSPAAEQATAELMKIAAHPDGRPEASDIVAGVLERLEKWFDCERSAVKVDACAILDILAESFAIAAILQANTIETLSNLLCDEDSSVLSAAMSSLARLAENLEGATAVIEAKSLDNIRRSKAGCSLKAEIIRRKPKHQESPELPCFTFEHFY